jgi:D-glycero-D-manno-heptose 1,7-bisphosphate phosphatase
VTRAAAFLDRDGVLNEPLVVAGHPHPPPGVAEVRMLPDVELACRMLREAGLTIVVVTNQPDIARGTTSREAVDALNAAICDPLRVDVVCTCPHDDADGCGCRKPKPGLIVDAAVRWDIDLARSTTVGDRWRDVEAGRAAGTATVFIDRGYAEPGPRSPDLVVQELIEAVPFILERSRIGRSNA